jgi:hypothetical protein
MTFSGSLDIAVRRAAVPETAPLDAAGFAELLLGRDLDPKQIETLRSEASRAILNCSRQWGKSTMAAVKAVYRAHSRPGALVLVASPSERQSKELLLKAARMVAALGLPVRGDGGADPSLVLPNGSRIVGLPSTEATVRGFSAASLILVDEASRVSDENYRALRPMLAVSEGDLWLMSTPAGKSGFFYETWTHGGPEWLRISVPATECPRISARFLEEERAELGPDCFAREYLCAFNDTGDEVFGRDLVERALIDEQGWEF